MERRSALKSMMLALAGGGVASAAKKPSSVAPHATMADSRDGTRIHFRDWGSGQPIVFVAPWALCSDWWDIPMMTLSERGWRCVAFDRRGHGRSEEPSRGYDYDTLADDIAAVMDTLDLQNVVLVGHSMGGAEVVRYLTRHRARRVSHAVLIAPTTPDRTPKQVVEAFRQAFRQDWPSKVAKGAPDFFGVPKNPVPVETMDWWTRQIVDRCSIKVLSDLRKALAETDFRPEMRTIQTPTLILHGDIDKSALLELTSRPTHELIAGSRLLVYENAAHALPYTHTERMLADIVAFARA
jgi:non-heme chloroperoxidase